MDYAEDEPWWKPRYWRKRTWAIVAAIVAVILIIVIVVPVKVAQANRYPNYSKLDYSLVDECESINDGSRARDETGLTKTCRLGIYIL
jgi:hypothetical protein